jgi:hypothetical protein
MNDAPIYVPIVKGKQYDILATKELHASVRTRIKPLIEAMPLNSKGAKLEDHLVSLCERIRKHLTVGELFVDFRGIDPEARVESGQNAVVFGYQLLKTYNRPVTPVFGLERNDALWRPLAAYVHDFGQGFCIRLKGEDLDSYAIEDTWQQVIERVGMMGLAAGQVDIVIDFGSLANHDIAELHEKVISFLAANQRAHAYRMIIVAGSSALKDVSEVEPDGVQTVVRRELDLWRELRVDLHSALRPVFGDYGVVHPDFSDAIVSKYINAKIRYTAGPTIRYFRGHGLLHPAKDYAQYRVLAAKVRSSAGFAGASTSFGDQYIDDCASGITATPGSPATWIKADMNTHMSHTVDHLVAELAQLEELIGQET